MPPIPDLVRISKLDTQFSSSPEYTQHVQYISGSALERRTVRKEERWKKERGLGRGRFGVVWLEQCTQGDSKGKVRAVKKLQKLDCDNYYRELEAIALFSHSKFEQCFVKSFGWYEDDDNIFIAMEYLPNGDLHRYLGSPLPEIEGQNLISQVLEGLDFMHRNEFAHRDLKPANILVVSNLPTWWVKIADFGISKRASDGLTELRTVTGTPAFTAPEILGFIQSDSYTNAVDIWSLGVIAFLILTGETLFKDQRRLGQYVSGSFAFPSDVLLANKVSSQGCEFIRSLMAPKSEDRPGAEESLQNPWLAHLIESIAPETQRIINTSNSPETSSYHLDVEASASWSTHDQSLLYMPQNYTDMPWKIADFESSASSKPLDQSSEVELHSTEKVFSPPSTTAESTLEARTQVYVQVPTAPQGHSATRPDTTIRHTRPTARGPSKFERLAGYNGPIEPKAKGHKRTNNISDISKKIFNYILFGHTTQATQEKAKEKKKKFYPPVSLSMVSSSANSMQFMDSDHRSIPFGFGRKPSESRPRSSSWQEEQPRRFSLLPASFSLKAMGIGRDYVGGPLDDPLEDSYKSERGDTGRSYPEQDNHGSNNQGSNSNVSYDWTLDSPVQQDRPVAFTLTPPRLKHYDSQGRLYDAQMSGENLQYNHRTYRAQEPSWENRSESSLNYQGRYLKSAPKSAQQAAVASYHSSDDEGLRQLPSESRRQTLQKNTSRYTDAFDEQGGYGCL